MGTLAADVANNPCCHRLPREGDAAVYPAEGAALLPPWDQGCLPKPGVHAGPQTHSCPVSTPISDCDSVAAPCAQTLQGL